MLTRMLVATQAHSPVTERDLHGVWYPLRCSKDIPPFGGLRRWKHPLCAERPHVV